MYEAYVPVPNSILRGSWLHMMHFVVSLLSFVALGRSGRAQSQARVLNKCPFPVYIRSVLGDEPLVQIVPPGEAYAETYRHLSAYNPAYGYNTSVGVSIKIVRGPEISSNMEEEKKMALFHQWGAVTQFEYTYDPSLGPDLPDLYYDISEIDDRSPRQFCQWGYSIRPDSSSCEEVVCPARCDSNCANVYNVWNDDHATRGCSSEVGLSLVLCEASA
jgi:hypothetical protein